MMKRSYIVYGYIGSTIGQSGQLASYDIDVAVEVDVIIIIYQPIDVHCWT